MSIWPKVGSVCAFYTCHTLGWGRKVRTGRTFNFLPISIKFHATGAKLSEEAKKCPLALWRMQPVHGLVVAGYS